VERKKRNPRAAEVVSGHLRFREKQQGDGGRASEEARYEVAGRGPLGCRFLFWR